MDAITAMMPLLNTSLKYYYVIEGDIKSYFDTVQHRKLLSLLKQRIADREIINLIAKFLNAGVMKNGLFENTDTGVPQGGLCKALHNPPYAKWKDMQSKCKKSLKLLHCCPIYFA